MYSHDVWNYVFSHDDEYPRAHMAVGQRRVNYCAVRLSMMTAAGAGSVICGRTSADSVVCGGTSAACCPVSDSSVKYAATAGRPQ